MNTYQCTDGSRVTQAQIDYREGETKREMLDRQEMAIGYNVCTICWENGCKPLDVSHHVSKKKAKEIGRSELCYANYNMQIIGRPHHNPKDGLNLQFSE